MHSEWFEARKHSLFTSCLSSPRISTFGWICPRTVIHCHPVLSSWPTCRVPPEAEVGPSQACDLKLGQALSDESAVLKSLQETQEQMAAEANHSETIAHQRKRKMIQEARKSQEAKGASGEIARAKSGVNSPNVHMGLVASNIDAIWGVRVNLQRAAVKKK